MSDMLEIPCVSPSRSDHHSSLVAILYAAIARFSFVRLTTWCRPCCMGTHVAPCGGV
jgi:hypothetical protein